MFQLLLHLQDARIMRLLVSRPYVVSYQYPMSVLDTLTVAQMGHCSRQGVTGIR